jgi:uncharacterized protein DUF4157
MYEKQVKAPEQDTTKALSESTLAAGGGVVSNAPQHSIANIQRKANNTGLPDNLKSGIEQLSGHSMDDVKVHFNSSKPAQLHAHAYAQGRDIHVGPGQEKHLPHEAWHVVQQKQGRVNPTMQMKGRVNVNDDVGLEREADMMGARATARIVRARGGTGSSKASDPNGNNGYEQAQRKAHGRDINVGTLNKSLSPREAGQDVRTTPERVDHKITGRNGNEEVDADAKPEVAPDNKTGEQKFEKEESTVPQGAPERVFEKRDREAGGGARPGRLQRKQPGRKREVASDRKEKAVPASRLDSDGITQLNGSDTYDSPALSRKALTVVSELKQRNEIDDNETVIAIRHYNSSIDRLNGFTANGPAVHGQTRTHGQNSHILHVRNRQGVMREIHTHNNGQMVSGRGLGPDDTWRYGGTPPERVGRNYWNDIQPRETYAQQNQSLNNTNNRTSNNHFSTYQNSNNPLGNNHFRNNHFRNNQFRNNQYNNHETSNSQNSNYQFSNNQGNNQYSTYQNCNNQVSNNQYNNNQTSNYPISNIQYSTNQYSHNQISNYQNSNNQFRNNPYNNNQISTYQNSNNPLGNNHFRNNQFRNNQYNNNQISNSQISNNPFSNNQGNNQYSYYQNSNNQYNNNQISNNQTSNYPISNIRYSTNQHSHNPTSNYQNSNNQFRNNPYNNNQISNTHNSNSEYPNYTNSPNQNRNPTNRNYQNTSDQYRNNQNSNYPPRNNQDWYDQTRNNQYINHQNNNDQNNYNQQVTPRFNNNGTTGRNTTTTTERGAVERSDGVWEELRAAGISDVTIERMKREGI